MPCCQYNPLFTHVAFTFLLFVDPIEAAELYDVSKYETRKMHQLRRSSFLLRTSTSTFDSVLWIQVLHMVAVKRGKYRHPEQVWGGIVKGRHFSSRSDNGLMKLLFIDKHQTCPPFFLGNTQREDLLDNCVVSNFLFTSKGDRWRVDSAFYRHKRWRTPNYWSRVSKEHCYFLQPPWLWLLV